MKFETRKAINLDQQRPSPPGTFHILTGKISYFVTRFLEPMVHVVMSSEKEAEESSANKSPGHFLYDARA